MCACGLFELPRGAAGFSCPRAQQGKAVHGHRRVKLPRGQEGYDAQGRSRDRCPWEQQVYAAQGCSRVELPTVAAGLSCPGVQQG